MKGNVFQQWLKEFCALVFTQAVQAFLLAVILILVVMAISESNTNGIGDKDPAGLLAIIALTSISKMEALIKKMFGLDSSLTDTSMNGGKGGLLGTYMALQMGKKVLDNVPKLASGVKTNISAGNKKKKAQLSFKKAQKQALERYDELYGNNNQQNENPQNTNQQNTNQQNNNFDSLKQKKDWHRTQDALDRAEEEYKKKMEDIKAEKRKGSRQITSSLLESTGAMLGAGTGAVYGAATGGDVLKSAMSGLGVGDAVGKGAVDLVYNAGETFNDAKKALEKTKGYSEKMKQYSADIARLQKNFDVADI